MAAHEYEMNRSEPWQGTHYAAREEIARLKAERDKLAREVERLREAAQLLVDADEHFHRAISTKGANAGTARVNALEALDHLRAALKGGDDERA